MPGLRQLRSGLDGIRLPDDVPEEYAQRPLRRHFNGQCEVIPEQACIWVAVYDRAKSAHRVDELKNYIPPRDRALQGTSSYINYFLIAIAGRITRSR